MFDVIQLQLLRYVVRKCAFPTYRTVCDASIPHERLRLNFSNFLWSQTVRNWDEWPS